jgi:hypothetical protein
MIMSPIKIVVLPMVYEWIESVVERRSTRFEELNNVLDDELGV